MYHVYAEDTEWQRLDKAAQGGGMGKGLSVGLAITLPAFESDTTTY
jgi:hypothetical protein